MKTACIKKDRTLGYVLAARDGISKDHADWAKNRVK